VPTYTYQCKACGHKQDVFHAMSAKPRIKCPECNSACKKLIGKGAGIIFKGTGFYETDYKKKGASKGEATTETKPKKETKTESKTETKTETKTNAKSNAAKKE